MHQGIAVVTVRAWNHLTPQGNAIRPVARPAWSRRDRPVLVSVAVVPVLGARVVFVDLGVAVVIPAVAALFRFRMNLRIPVVTVALPSNEVRILRTTQAAPVGGIGSEAVLVHVHEIPDASGGSDVVCVAIAVVIMGCCAVLSVHWKDVRILIITIAGHQRRVGFFRPCQAHTRSDSETVSIPILEVHRAGNIDFVDIVCVGVNLEPVREFVARIQVGRLTDEVREVLHPQVKEVNWHPCVALELVFAGAVWISRQICCRILEIPGPYSIQRGVGARNPQVTRTAGDSGQHCCDHQPTFED